MAALEVAGAGAEATRQALVQKIGENIALRRFARVQTHAKVALYIHTDRKTGVLVEFEGADDAGKDVAMHVAFHRPAYLAKADVPAELVAREREILTARANESGKPAEIAARMVEGGLNKFLAESTLLGQAFVKDDKQSVEKMLAARKSKLLGYRFLVVGEGLPRKSTDFAAEVKAAAEQVR
jgi:elongation factor Ts